MRDAPINLRALPEQRDLVDHAGSLLGKNRSDFMLEVACERAQAVVLDLVFFSLDVEKFKQFTAMIDISRDQKRTQALFLNKRLGMQK